MAAAWNWALKAVPSTLLTLGLVPALFGQTNSPAAARPANRYLLIVETSKGMQPRAGGVLGLVNTLVTSGFNGQAHAGDSLGVWTYNDQLHAGEFPLQTLLHTNRMVAKSVVEFLQSRKYEKKAHLERVLPQVQRLIKNSDFITVILVSDGTQQLQGTPFDDPINKAYKAWESDQAKAKMPIVTILRGKKGELTHYVVSPVPWPVEMPPLPEELKVAAAPKRPAAEPPKPAPIGVPLIVTGKKPTSVELAPTTSQPAAVPTVGLAQSPTTPQGAAQTETAKPEMSAARITAPTITSLPVKTESGPETPAGETKTTPASSLVEPHPPTPASPPAKSAVTPILSEPTAATPPADQATTGQTPRIQDAARTVSANEPTEIASPSPTATLQPSPPPAPASAQTATAIPPRGLFSHKGIWIAGFALLVLGFASWIWYRRHARTVPHESLITRSFDRDKP